MRSRAGSMWRDEAFVDVQWYSYLPLQERRIPWSTVQLLPTLPHKIYNYLEPTTFFNDAKLQATIQARSMSTAYDSSYTGNCSRRNNINASSQAQPQPSSPQHVEAAKAELQSQSIGVAPTATMKDVDQNTNEFRGFLAQARDQFGESLFTCESFNFDVEEADFEDRRTAPLTKRRRVSKRAKMDG